MTTSYGRAPIIGRENELAILQRALDEVRSGVFRIVVVGGEAGIGKSRLVDEFCSTLPTDFISVRGQCVDLDSDGPPYGPIVQALRGLIGVLGLDSLRDAAGMAAEPLSLLLPELGPSDEADGRYTDGVGRLFEGVATMLTSISRTTPLVLVIDDVHWADPATLELLRFLAVFDRDSPLLLVLTFRTEDASARSALRAWLPELDRNRVAQRLELSRLTRRQARVLARELSGTGSASIDFAVLYERSEGVPFFIEELLSWQETNDAEHFPETLRDILLARYAVVSDGTQQVLRLIAAGGAGVEHGLLVDVSPFEESRLELAALEAVGAHILVVEGTTYRFRHALVRDAVHRQLLPGERMRFHTRYAEALSSTSPGLNASEIAYHWMAAHNLPRAFEAALDAMTAAKASYAFSVAARMGERAIDLWQHVPHAQIIAARSREELMAETAYILRNAGRSERAISLIDEAIAVSTRDDASFFGRMLRDKASFLANVGRQGSVELLREALVVLESEPRSVLRANFLGELAARLMLDARFAEAIPVADEAFVEADAVGSRARMSVAINIRGITKLSSGRIDEGLADLEQAGVLAEGNDSAMMRFCVNYSDALAMLGRFDESIAVARTGGERARERGVERTSGVMFASNTIGPLLSMGQTDAADELLDRALELDAPIGFSSDIRLLKLRSVLLRGDAGEAARLLREWLPGLLQQARIDARLDRVLSVVGAEISLETSHVSDAWSYCRTVLDQQHRDFAALDLPMLAMAARIYAVVHTRLPADEAPTVPDRITEVLDRLSTWPTAGAYGALVRAELSDSSAMWAAASDAVDENPVTGHLWSYVRARLAESLAANGNRQDALEVAADARARARSASAGFVIARLDDLESRLGLASPAAAHPSGHLHGYAAPLTARERQVLDLIGEGLSNRQISERLFISAKTASVHVSNILRKVGASSRTEAVFLDRTGSGAL